MGTAVSAIQIGTEAYSFTQQRKARKEERKAGRAREAQGRVARRRERQVALAAAAKQRASIRAQSATQLGVGAFSTAVEQAAGSITSQLSANIGFASQLQALEDVRTGHLRASASATERAALSTAVGGFAGSVQDALPTPTGGT